MLVANRTAPEPAWVPVLGADFLFAPIDRLMIIRARRAAREASQAAIADDAGGSAIDMLEEMGDAMSRALLIEGMRDWRHVCVEAVDENGDPLLDAEGDPVFDVLSFSREALEVLLGDPVTFEALDAAYVVPFVTRERERAAPGNGSSASPNGIGEAETPGPGSAICRAALEADDAARNAPMSSKSRIRPKRKTSGAS